MTMNRDSDNWGIKINWHDLIAIKHDISIVIDRLNSVLNILNDYIEDDSINDNIWKNNK